MSDLRQERAVRAAEQALISAVFRSGGKVPSAAELGPLFRKLWQVGYDAGADDEKHGRELSYNSARDVFVHSARISRNSDGRLQSHNYQAGYIRQLVEDSRVNDGGLDVQPGTAKIQGPNERPIHQLGDSPEPLGSVHSEPGEPASSSDTGLS